MRTILLCLFAALLAACKPPEQVITGQVFIPTKGGANVKLGGVQIYAVPADLAEQREREQEAALAKDKATAKAGRDALAKAEADAEAARLKSNEAFALWQASLSKIEKLTAIEVNNLNAMQTLPAKQREKANEILAQIKDAKEAERPNEVQLKADYKTLDGAHETAKKKVAEAKPGALQDSDFVALVPRLQKLAWPEAVAQATTDADGKYSLKLKPGRHALIASGRRLVTTFSELYFWRVPVPDGASELMLTGANARVMEGVPVGTKKLDAE